MGNKPGLCWHAQACSLEIRVLHQKEMLQDERKRVGEREILAYTSFLFPMPVIARTG